MILVSSQASCTAPSMQGTVLDASDILASLLQSCGGAHNPDEEAGAQAHPGPLREQVAELRLQPTLVIWPEPTCTVLFLMATVCIIHVSRQVMGEQGLQ